MIFVQAAYWALILAMTVIAVRFLSIGTFIAIVFALDKMRNRPR